MGVMHARLGIETPSVDQKITINIMMLWDKAPARQNCGAALQDWFLAPGKRFVFETNSRSDSRQMDSDARINHLNFSSRIAAAPCGAGRFAARKIDKNRRLHAPKSRVKNLLTLDQDGVAHSSPSRNHKALGGIVIDDHGRLGCFRIVFLSQTGR
jgi:hypothetical protein